MALDGAMLSFIAKEINTKLEGARVDRIQQPEKDEIDITFRLTRGTAKLILSASSANARIHFSQLGKENPLSPPMFCMLLRKHLSGAKFIRAEQPGLERILFFHFDCRNEFGDEVEKVVAVEIMGRCSNIMLLGPDGKIIDSVKHIDLTMSSRRQVLPGLAYELPPKQDKIDITAADIGSVMKALRAHAPGELSKAVLHTVQGVSPIVCRELCERALHDADARTDALDDPEKSEKLALSISKLGNDIKSGSGVPSLISDAKTGKPMDFSFLEITQYGQAAAVRRYPDFSGLLDAFYAERDRVERVSQRSHDILGVITNASERIGRKLERQKTELAQCGDREKLKICGDLLSSSLYRLHKGVSSCRLENYYDGNKMVEIRLNPALTPVQNAQKYYRDYRKASTAEKYLREQIAIDQSELEYLDTVFDELARANGESDLAEIRAELMNQGYLRRSGGKHAQRRRESQPLRFRSSDGFEIFVGRNNRQNDLLTLKTAAKSDIWLHAKNIPGAHVIISADGKAVPDGTLTQAAILAALNCKARESSKVPVDYTYVKNVKKPAGAKPGKVIYVEYRTAYVTPDPKLMGKLKAD